MMSDYVKDRLSKIIEEKESFAKKYDPTENNGYYPYLCGALKSEIKFLLIEIDELKKENKKYSGLAFLLRK